MILNKNFEFVSNFVSFWGTNSSIVHDVIRVANVFERTWIYAAKGEMSSPSVMMASFVWKTSPLTGWKQHDMVTSNTRKKKVDAILWPTRFISLLLLFIKLSQLQLKYQNSFAGIEMRNTWNSWNEINDPRLILGVVKRRSVSRRSSPMFVWIICFCRISFLLAFCARGGPSSDQPVCWCAIERAKRVAMVEIFLSFFVHAVDDFGNTSTSCWSTQTDWLEISHTNAIT